MKQLLGLTAIIEAVMGLALIIAPSLGGMAAVWRRTYKHESNLAKIAWAGMTKQAATGKAKRHYGELLFAALALVPVASLAQSLAPTPPSLEQAELSKVEEWVLSRGNAESIAPEIAAIFGLGSDRLPVKVKSFRMPNGVSRAFAVSTNSSQKGIVISALKIIQDNNRIYALGTAWLTDRSGTLQQTIHVDASGAEVVQNNSRAAEFVDIKAFFLKKLQAAGPINTSSPSPRISATAAGGKNGTK